MAKPLIGVLALQGAFIEHERMLSRLGAETVELRSIENLARRPDGLVLPGGESTVQHRLLRREGMYETMKGWIAGGLPVLATCAGMILLARHISNDTDTCFGTLPVTVRRNAYGRQLGSFATTTLVKGIGPMRVHFIRAPYVESAAAGVDILATVNNRIVAVQYGAQLALAFHPELGQDTRLHSYFLGLVKQNKRNILESR